jgi:hypothetical protein
MVKGERALSAAQVTYLGKKITVYIRQDSKPWLEGYEVAVSRAQGGTRDDQHTAVHKNSVC